MISINLECIKIYKVNLTKGFYFMRLHNSSEVNNTNLYLLFLLAVSFVNPIFFCILSQKIKKIILVMAPYITLWGYLGLYFSFWELKMKRDAWLCWILVLTTNVQLIHSLPSPALPCSALVRHHGNPANKFEIDHVMLLATDRNNM